MKKSMMILICVLLCIFSFTAGISAEPILPNVLPESNIPSNGVQLFNADPDDETSYSENAVTVKLAFYNCETNKFVIMPMEVTVEPQTAVKYGVTYGETTSGYDTGFTVGDTDVTVVDALCAAHEMLYGEEFSPETMGRYISSDMYFSYVMKIFEVQTENGISFYVNGEIPMAYNSEASYWFGYAINQCILEDGDFIYFFGYESMYLSEWVSAFDQTSVEVEPNEEFTLTLLGHAAMAWEDVEAAPIAGMELYALNENGTVGSSLGKTTDSEGKVTLSFDTAGTYYVTAQGTVTDEYGMEGEIAAPYCKVTVAADEVEVTNNAPVVKAGAIANAEAKVNKAFAFDLTTVFEDADGDTLTYTAKVNDGEAVATEAAYGFTPSAAGTYTIVFTASDGKAEVSHTLTLEVRKVLDVANNVVDITDKQIAKYMSYYCTATAVTISGADIMNVSENDTDIYIVLDYETAQNATMKADFISTVSHSRFSVEQSANTVTLENGEGTLSVKLVGNYNGSAKGDITYNLHFSVAALPTEIPTRLKDSAEAELFRTQLLALDLTDYFVNAQSYFLIEGEEKTVFKKSQFEKTFTEAGTHELFIGAVNVMGECPDTVKVTVTVKEIEGDLYLNITTSNGAVNYATITNENGAAIEGLEAYLKDTTIFINLPKDYPLSGKVITSYNLTQTGDLPFITTKNGTSGTSSGKAVNNKFTSNTVSLSNGAASFTFYLYNSTPSTNNNVYTTYTVKYKVKNELPALVKGQAASVNAEITAGDTYNVPLGDIFTDADGDALTYQMSVNGGAYADVTVDENGNFVYTTDIAGDYTLKFTANDTKDTSSDTFTVKLSVANSTETNAMVIHVPEGLAPAFAVANGFGDDNVDVIGESLAAEAGEAVNGLVPYTVSYPSNAEYLSVRTAEWGGMAIAVEKDGSAVLRKATVKALDFSDSETTATYTVTYGDHKAVAGNAGQYLLVVGNEYVFTAAPANTSTYKSASQTSTLEEGTDVCEVAVKVPFNGPKTITVTTGAVAQMFDYNKYYDFTELPVRAVVDNGDGTTTYYFTSTQNDLSYRVSMEGYATQAGYLPWQGNVTVTFNENSVKPDAESSGSVIQDNSVLVNVNAQNHLKMDVNGSYTLKAYRSWEIIPVSYENQIISPDFHFNVISGEDVVSLTPKDSPSNGNDDWMTVKGLKEGIAIIEVTYDAISISGANTNSWNGVYGASDPARTGLVVVQVGGSSAKVDFGIECKASQGSVLYEKSTPKAWDAEFDTLYFFGDNGELKLSPSAANDTITEVAVSADKGETWTALNGKDGVYTAPIFSGNNIIRVITEKGVAYQVVRGDKISYSVSIVQEAGSETVDTVVDPGDTLRIVLDGIHTPIPKMAGNYNPGYQGNTDGKSSVHMSYTFNGTTVEGAGAQYDFATAANYIDITVPEDAEVGGKVALTDGYIGVGVIGLTTFNDGGDSHRNIPDGGCSTRGNETTFHTRSMLPEITIPIGDLNFKNTPPTVADGAVTAKEIKFGQKCAINPETLFADKDGQELTYTVSVNGGEAQAIDATYKFVPSGVGNFTLTFTANDGFDEVSHTVTVTVTENPENPGNLDFGLEFDEIKGYVTVSFEDNALRVAGEKGLKYPVALGSIVEPTKVPFKEGDNVASVTLRLLDAVGIEYAYTGSVETSFYLGAIKNFEVDNTPYDSMAEFDAGSGSGWMITLNDVFITKGCSEFTVKDSDVVRWQYTCQFGADIGDPWYDYLHEDVEELIAAIGNVTLESEAAIKAARAAYDELNAYQQGEVSNYDVLTAAEAAFAELNKPVDPEDDIKVIDPAELPFTDVEVGDWYAEEVAYVYSYGLMMGTSETSFGPEANLTRAMMATILYRIEGKPAVSGANPFSDVKAGEWYTNAIIWAAENGIVKGVTTTTYEPTTNITREQMACMMYRYAQYKGADMSASNNLAAFADAAKVSSWAAKEMKWAVAKGLINGMGDGSLTPQGTATRAQAATVLMRFNENIVK